MAQQPPTKMPALSDRPESVNITPMSEWAEPLTRKGRFQIEVPIFAMTDEGRPRKVLIPARDSRYVSTQYSLEKAPEVFPMLFSTQYLTDHKLEALSWKIAENGELLVKVVSFDPTPSGAYLEHGKPLCVLQFVNSIVINEK